MNIRPKLQAIWEQWPEIKDTVPDYGFREYIDRKYGFQFTRDVSTNELIVTKITNEANYLLFLLSC